MKGEEHRNVCRPTGPIERDGAGMLGMFSCCADDDGSGCGREIHGEFLSRRRKRSTPVTRANTSGTQ